MDITEQNDTHLTIVSKSMLLTYVYALVAILLGLLLIFGGKHVQNNGPIFRFIVGPIGITAGLSMIISPIKSVLVIDKNLQQISIKQSYLFGLIPVTKRISLADITAFVVQHQYAFRLSPAKLVLIFKAGHRKLTFSSAKLHFADVSSYLDSRAYDPRNATEETFLPVIAGYLNVPVTPKERLIDATNLKKRLLYSFLILVSGFVCAISATWVYYHLIH